MRIYCDAFFCEFELEIEKIKKETIDPISQAKQALQYIHVKLKELYKWLKKYIFSSIEEEIHFFKELKPRILSKLIYYNSIYKIEAKKPCIGEKIIESYLNEELCKLKKFFDNNLEFYKYYRTNSTYLDYKYFVRGKHDIKLSLDTFYFEADHNFSTSHDYKVAKIIANDLIQVYLEDKLHSTLYRDKSLEPPKLNWTGSKTALIELIYALHSQGVFDNGNVDIKVISKIFESAFNVNLGDFYHTFMELKSRKINRTKFLDNLSYRMIRKTNRTKRNDLLIKTPVARLKNLLSFYNYM